LHFISLGLGVVCGALASYLPLYFYSSQDLSGTEGRDLVPYV
jgi:hypothetical protein